MSNRLPALNLTIQWREPEAPSYWWVYARRNSVLVPARLFMCDHEPGNEENKLDRGSIPFLAGEIAGKWVDPKELWLRVLRVEVEPNHWACAWPMIPKEGLMPQEEYYYQMALLDHAKSHDVTNPLAKPYKAISLAAIPLPF